MTLLQRHLHEKNRDVFITIYDFGRKEMSEANKKKRLSILY